MGKSPKTLTPDRRDALLAALRLRFEGNMNRHPDLLWDEVAARLAAAPQALWPLLQMEETGGEPDVAGLGPAGEVLFMDCSPQSPSGRRSLCYDPQALDSRKANKPAGSAVGMAAQMGVRLLTEAEYRHLQTLGEFDTKTTSWVEAPGDIRAQGGGLFGDCRYGRVFIYHNGAESYYGSRGFRGVLEV